MRVLTLVRIAELGFQRPRIQTSTGEKKNKIDTQKTRVTYKNRATVTVCVVVSGQPAIAEDISL